MSQVRVRIAPSPTGFWHIGNTRTALYNFLFAKKQGGKFILRLEDTDRERLVPGAAENIIEAVKWLGLNYDEGPDIGGPFAPYTQSERMDLFKKHAEELFKKGLAFKDEDAIRFRTQKEGKTSWHDLIGGKQIAFENSTQEDFVILKSDGFPTYNFANVIDDHYMQITHVIRGPEFISSTPKHLMLYEALGWEPPRFAHVPMILGPDKAKLSKRHGAKPVLEFKSDGFLPEAVVNYMALLGWTPPSGREILSLEEMVKEFDIKDVNVSSPIFDFKKLEWMNGEYIRKMSDEELAKRLIDYLSGLPVQAEEIEDKVLGKDSHKEKKALPQHLTEEKIAELTPLIKERIKTLSDFVPLTNFIFERPEYDKKFFGQLKIDNTAQVLQQILEKLEAFKKPWTKEEFEQAFQGLAKALRLSNTQMFQLIRVAISGQLVTPPLFESIQIIGVEETLERIKKSLEYLSR